MILLCLACAYVAFLIAFNQLNSCGACVIAGVVTFIATFIFLHFELDILFYIEMGLIVLGIIVTLIKKSLK